MQSMNQVMLQSVFHVLPELVWCGFGVILMLLQPFVKSRQALTFTALVGAAAGTLVTFSTLPGSGFSGLIQFDVFALFFHWLVGLIAFLVILSSDAYLEREGLEGAEFYALILFATAGMGVLSSAQELLTAFIGLEMSSIASYILAGYRRDSIKSSEASMKYFLLGSFATAFFLYGIALVYGVTGSTNLMALANANGTLLRLGLTLILVGLGFKVAAAPFQIWTPDVYEGAPTPVTALFSAGPKAATFALLLRIFSTVHAATDFWFWAFWVLAVLTMFVGNLGAIVQNNVKRMLAYSSIAHAGYTLVAFAAVTSVRNDPDAVAPAYAAVLFYLASYSLVSIGAFTVVSEIGGRGERYLTYDDYAGLGTRQPFAAAALSLFLLSFLGLPITAGFFGKLYIFTAAVKSKLIWLAVLMAINSTIGAYYYFRLIVVMYMREYKGVVPADTSKGLSPTAAMVVTVAVLITLYLGLLPNHILGIVLSQPLMLSAR
ncbi:MAG TPA: NADH-quinone oxidoreductase subunit N [Candidatus Acidoferrales bacterium]|jgi:NADH-quinone oxidoreductase subunit N|nr:NADH-quinone oxidoreductase subunit N [Candidatus Acidoferrales bacterium]